MLNDPPLTYRSALKILSTPDQGQWQALGPLLDAILLGSPSAGISNLFRWIDQKNEAVGLCRDLATACHKRLRGMAGRERQESVRAAHTVIVLLAYFDATHKILGRKGLQVLDLTETDMLRISNIATSESANNGIYSLAELQPDTEAQRRSHLLRTAAAALVDGVFNSEVPAPCADIGYYENRRRILEFYDVITAHLNQFLLALVEGGKRLIADRTTGNQVSQVALQVYTSSYVEFAKDVPEFMIWGLLNENSATRQEIALLRNETRHLLDRQFDAFAGLEKLLQLATAGGPGSTSIASTIFRANRAIFTESVVATDSVRHGGQLRFPTVEQAYITPQFRTTRYELGMQVADEQWWDGRPVRDDLDVFLAAYMADIASQTNPMLVVGHPGAGKSVFTIVLAARLPPESHVVVRVPLRFVDADAPVYEQVQQALDTETHGRVGWHELLDMTPEATKVVLLDGFDEMLQASAIGRSAYLQEVVNFQRREAALGHRVVTIVTSRTVVTNRARIPASTVVVRLEEFNNDQIRRWLAVWTDINRGIARSGLVRLLAPDEALKYGELSRQPLLLFLLALYVSDPKAVVLSTTSSTARLYGHLLEDFVRREVTKVRPSMTEQKTMEEVDNRLWRLSVAALAMFNRGRQHVSDEELGEDLVALRLEDVGISPRLIGQQAVGQFFFVHIAAVNAHLSSETRQSYEFLHATFGEYLMARHVVQLLYRLAIASAHARHSLDVDDDELEALLSHHPLAVRRNILEFAHAMFLEMNEEVRNHALQGIESLSGRAFRRARSDRYSTYRPTTEDHLRRLAAYSANLCLLRVYLSSSEPVRIQQLCGNRPDSLHEWKVRVRTWYAGLDATGLQSLASTLRVEDGLISRRPDVETVPFDAPLSDELAYAALAMDGDLLRRLGGGVV